MSAAGRAAEAPARVGVSLRRPVRSCAHALSSPWTRCCARAPPPPLVRPEAARGSCCSAVLSAGRCSASASTDGKRTAPRGSLRPRLHSCPRRLRAPRGRMSFAWACSTPRSPLPSTQRCLPPRLLRTLPRSSGLPWTTSRDCSRRTTRRRTRCSATSASLSPTRPPLRRKTAARPAGCPSSPSCSAPPRQAAISTSGRSAQRSPFCGTMSGLDETVPPAGRWRRARSRLCCG
mmetsp:Transcript_28599/g.95984  ORF Transcript_28599/g.95984 Transcript_28599/m.95984 type:complete len:233 (+) Transcript_28599:360-1058(+)